MGSLEENQHSVNGIIWDENHPEIILKAVVDGELLPLSASNDPIIGEELIGKGYAIRPTSGLIYSPVQGQVTSIAPTRHALTLTTQSNETLLIHLGIDTIELKGKGFDAYVSEGDQVEVGDLLVSMDLKLLADEDYDDLVCVILLDKPDRQLAAHLFEDKQMCALKSPALKITKCTDSD